MRLSRSSLRLVRRRLAAIDAPRTGRPRHARAVLTALLGAVAPTVAAARLSHDLTALRGTLADHSEIGAEQSVGEVMASLEAVRRAMDDSAPEDRATMAAALRRAREL